MDDTLWELFWTTGLPEAYALAKEGEETNRAGADVPNGPQRDYRGR